MTVFDDEGDILADNGFTAIGAIFKKVRNWISCIYPIIQTKPTRSYYDHIMYDSIMYIMHITYCVSIWLYQGCSSLFLCNNRNYLNKVDIGN